MIFKLRNRTTFVNTMLTYILKGQNEIIDTMIEKQERLKYYHKKMVSENFSDVENEVFFLILQSQLFTSDFEASISDGDILEILIHTEHSQRSMKRALKELEEKGYLVKVTKRPIKHMIKKGFFDYDK